MRQYAGYLMYLQSTKPVVCEHWPPLNYILILPKQLFEKKQAVLSFQSKIIVNSLMGNLTLMLMILTIALLTYLHLNTCIP